MSQTEVIQPRWSGLVIVAAPGPSLTPEVAEACRGQRVLAIGEAWQRVPWAEVLYHCDAKLWDAYNGFPEFTGERWSLHDKARSPKLAVAEKYGIRLVASKMGAGFSTDPAFVHEGCHGRFQQISNSGYQAVGLAILMGGNPVVLCGFDMRSDEYFYKRYKRPEKLRIIKDYSRFAPIFDDAAKRLPPDKAVLNATPNSGIKGFPSVNLEDALMRQAA